MQATIEPSEVESQLKAGRDLDDILEDSEYQTTWSNHWDINPDGHGGCFVRYDSDHWDVIVTTPPDVMPGGFAKGRHMFERFEFYPDDVWNTEELNEAIENAPESFENDPYVGYTDDMRKFAGQYSHGGPDSALDLPAAKSAAMDFHSYYGAYHLNGRDSWVNESEYWDTLEDMGVDIEEFDQ